MDQHFDLGPEVLDRIYEAMRIDAQWSIRQERGFTWWGHRLAQRVWAEPPIFHVDAYTVCLHAETDFIRCISPDIDPLPLVNLFNIFSSLSAFVWDHGQRSLKLSSSAYFFDPGELTLLLPAFMCAVAIQAAEAHRMVDTLAECLQGEADVSAHPESGIRPEPDEMLAVVHRAVAPAGALPSRFVAADFATAQQLIHKWQVGFATCGEAGFTAEFPFFGWRPAVLAWQDPDPKLETALLTVRNSESHPVLGNGAFVKLTLPVQYDLKTGCELVARLNAAEAAGWTGFAFRGAWCWLLDTSDVCFVSFIPNLCWNADLVSLIAAEMLGRTRWARGRLDIVFQ
jgi:hypothetical protein